MPAFHSSLNKMAGWKGSLPPPPARPRARPRPATHGHAGSHLPTHPPPRTHLGFLSASRTPRTLPTHTQTHRHADKPTPRSHPHALTRRPAPGRWARCEKSPAPRMPRQEVPRQRQGPSFLCHAATSGRINGVQLFSSVIHFAGFGSSPDPPSVSCSPSLSLSLSPEFVLHFVMLRASHPYSMAEVRHQPQPCSGVEFGGTLDIPLWCHGKKRLSKNHHNNSNNNKKAQRDSCKGDGALLSKSQSLRFLLQALIWICLAWELFLLRYSIFVFFIGWWHCTPLHSSVECLLLDTCRSLPPSNLLHWKSGDYSRILCVLAVWSCRKVNNQLSIDFL